MPEVIKDILILDFVMFTIIALLSSAKPENINPLWGYRTKRSMKNQENWDFAQDYSSKKMMLIIPAMLVCQVPVLFGVRSEWLILSSVISMFIVMIYMIYSTEKALKKFENENG